MFAFSDPISDTIERERAKQLDVAQNGKNAGISEYIFKSWTS